MSYIAAALPYIAAAGAAYGAVKQGQASAVNAQIATNEQGMAVNQSNAQEGMVRRQGREALGRQAAAFGAAGVGYGGSSAVALDQSAVNQELDALNTRYKGQVTGYGYGIQSGFDKSQSSQYGVMAGAALLKGIGANYSYAPNQPSTAQNNPALQPG